MSRLSYLDVEQGRGGFRDERLDTAGVLRRDRSRGGLERLPEGVRGVRRGAEGKTLCLDVGVLDGEREDVGIQRPVSDKTRLNASR